MKKRQRRLKSLTDIRRFLSMVINQYENGECDAEKLRTVSYALNILSAVIKDSSLEERVEKLEKAWRKQNE